IAFVAENRGTDVELVVQDVARILGWPVQRRWRGSRRPARHRHEAVNRDNTAFTWMPQMRRWRRHESSNRDAWGQNSMTSALTRRRLVTTARFALRDRIAALAGMP